MSHLAITKSNSVDSTQAFCKKRSKEPLLLNRTGIILGASFLTIGILVCSVVVSPWFAPLLIGVIALTILGIKLIHINKEVRRAEISSESSTSELSDPVGLINNGSNDCWINSSIQFLMNIQSYREAICSHESALANALKPDIEAYLDAQRLRRTVADRTRAKRETIRNLLHARVREQSDPFEVLNGVLSEIANIRYKLREYSHLHDSPEQPIGYKLASHSCFIPCNPTIPKDPEEAELSFAHQMKSFFNPRIEDSDPRDRSWAIYCRRFEEPPSDLLVKQESLNFDRTTQALIATHHNIKINSRFTFSSNQYIASDRDQPEEQYTYVCDAFIMRIGDSNPESGHFVTYLRKGDKYWLCNDETVTEITQDVFEKKMRTAYILHFKKQ